MASVRPPVGIIAHAAAHAPPAALKVDKGEYDVR